MLTSRVEHFSYFKRVTEALLSSRTMLKSELSCDVRLMSQIQNYCCANFVQHSNYANLYKSQTNFTSHINTNRNKIQVKTNLAVRTKPNNSRAWLAFFCGQAARKHDIPYPTFVLYANRVHNMLGPSVLNGLSGRTTNVVFT